ncbi:hypothetical protein [Spiroplasma endosymbiont of Labia minor]|uniref:hypothetical protein n=1 Tax=Spiroplasma endosymbiont of Labia minor TaxID=3066305 RepID=UPI0030CDD08D
MRSLRIVGGVFSLFAGIITILSVIIIVKTALVFPSAELLDSFVLNKFTNAGLLYKIINILMLIFASILIIFSFVMYTKKYKLSLIVISMIIIVLIFAVNILMYFVYDMRSYYVGSDAYENSLILRSLSISLAFVTFVLYLLTIILENNKNKNNVKENTPNQIQYVQTSNHNLLRENEDSVDLHSKLNRLRSSLNKKANEFTDDSAEISSESSSLEDSENINSSSQAETIVVDNEKQAVNANSNIVKVVEKPQFDNSIKDPYKQTIIPRRSGVSNHFDRPIGNTKQTQPKKAEHKRPELIDSYKNKVFIEDSDRIWDALKQQERPGINVPLPDAQVNNINDSDEYKRNQAEQLNENTNTNNTSISPNNNETPNNNENTDSEDSQFSIDWGED